MADVIRGYASVGLIERVELVRWAGAQIPLQEWSRQFMAAGFQWEANRLRRIARFFSEGVRGDNEWEKDRRKRLMDEMLEALRGQQDKPLLAILDRYEEFLKIPKEFV